MPIERREGRKESRRKRGAGIRGEIERDRWEEGMKEEWKEGGE